ncbi:single-stranded-DNA-specific exonuclease RecJ [Sulfuriferula multivorans]|uniref:Single-stranded-DNA-specific exonuclease RecJ n=1 Tax=Sulfuriferula multivorans TaxID=1559896 RepID=A0A401JCL5_9PROT|nr:single-stranded-DNA-specific exonuclease RecJ [Sulfuriferula multivorans]GBL45314.1 single-stranded-DNA-specific exonuclease RecJ [Sulfuriferula multivorans]
MVKITARTYPESVAHSLTASGLHPVLARIYAARGIAQPAQLETRLAGLIPFDSLKNIHAAAQRLADAIGRQERILVVADYDADGATACAVALRGLALLGGSADYLVPNRFEYGYGLTPEIVHLAAERRPDLIVTVDNGIASVAGVAEAKRLGIEVLVTDHHLPGDELPEALIVNPNQPGCPFPGKNLAGVGVMFYVLLALRAELRTRGMFSADTAPNLAQLLDIVALGTVADVVRLDANNRILVEQGLRRMRAGRACAGIRALFQAAARDPARASAFDLGFMVGPRLNAAGRLEDMSLGIACLLTDDDAAALAIARRLHALNAERRSIEADMQETALASLDAIETADSYSLALFDPDWHQGVIGILASRLKDKFHRPAVCFARGNDGEIKGSGRSIGALHLRDALDIVSKRAPDLILKFGGHAAAAGLSIRAADFERFAALFEQTVQGLLSPGDLAKVIETDGELPPESLNLELAQALDGQVWGQGFAAPSFSGVFRVVQQRVVGEKHLKLRLQMAGQQFESILFFRDQPLPERIHAVYRPEMNVYNGSASLQLKLEYWAEET